MTMNRYKFNQGERLVGDLARYNACAKWAWSFGGYSLDEIEIMQRDSIRFTRIIVVPYEEKDNLRYTIPYASPILPKSWKKDGARSYAVNLFGKEIWEIIGRDPRAVFVKGLE